MILFVFEGKDDKTYFESVKRLFFPEKSETFVCTYNSNIYSLYTKLKFEEQLSKYVNTELCEVAILSAFPIFLFDYFGRKIVSSI